MPSITLNNPEDKATVKRFLSLPDTRIITATVARLYIAYPDPNQWTYSGILGAVALIQTSNTFYLRIVDLLYGKGVVWEQELYKGFVYTQDTPFFHTFQADNHVAGFSFADEHEADVFYGKVYGRAGLRPFKPVPSAGALAKSGKAGGGQGRNKIPLHNGKLDKTRIGLPSDFRHVGHIGWDPDVGFDAQNIDPSWRTLFEQLDKFGVSRQQINENATFITEFVNARGGPVATGTTGETGTGTGTEDLARTDSPPRQTCSPSPLQQRRPPPPPPPVQTSTAASLVSPAPFHGYLPRPLAQVMASLSFGSSTFYGSSSSSTTVASAPQSPQSPKAQPQIDLPDPGPPSEIQRATSPPLPPPPPPPPPPMSPSLRTKSPGVGVPPLSINTGNLGSGVHGQGNRPTVMIAGSRGVPGVTQGGEGTPAILKSPVESSLLASIRESGGLAGLRKTGGIRSPPPREKLVSYASSNSLAHGGGSQGDLVSALVAALHRRQTKLTYSDDEEQSDDAWDVDED